MPFLVAMGIGTIAGGVKYGIDKSNYNKKLALAAQTQRYSPWTGMQAQVPNAPGGPTGDILAGAGTGASLGQGIMQMQQSTQLNNSLSSWLNSASGVNNMMSNPYNTPGSANQTRYQTPFGATPSTGAMSGLNYGAAPSQFFNQSFSPGSSGTPAAPPSYPVVGGNSGASPWQTAWNNYQSGQGGPLSSSQPGIDPRTGLPYQSGAPYNQGGQYSLGVGQ